MKFGLMYLFQQDPAKDTGDHAGKVIREAIDQAIYAEELGFDRVLAGRTSLLALRSGR